MRPAGDADLAPVRYMVLDRIAPAAYDDAFDPSDLSDAAVEALGGHGLRRLLVVDSDGNLVGILSWADLAPHLSERGLGHTVSLIIDHR